MSRTRSLRKNPYPRNRRRSSRRIPRKFRNAVRQQADIQGLNAKLDGEKSKEDSLKASFAQMDSIPDSDVPEMEEPKKSSGAAMVGAGAAVAVIGAILGFAVNPILAAVAAVGIILAILGAANNKTYKKKVQEYGAYQASSAQRQEAQKKKADIRTQLEEVQSAVADYERQIADRNEELLADQSDANAWFAKWGKEGAEISEDAINEILDEAEQIKKLREKKQGLSGKQQFVTEKMEMIAAERADIEDAYPEIREKTFAEGLGMLRSAEMDYKIKADKLQTAVGKLARFLTEAGASREELQEEESPGIAELMKIQADAEKELAEAVENANEAFAPIEIAVTTENAALAYREAEQILNEYEQHSDKIKSRDERQRKKREQIDSLQEKLDKKAAVLRDCHADLAMPKRLSKIREEVGRAASLKAKMSEMDVEKRRQKAKLDEASKAVEIFRSRYGKFEPESEDILEEIYAKAASYAKHDDVRKPLEDQKGAIGQERAAEHERMGAKEQELKDGIAELEKRRDKLRDEYMQKSDFIRQADQSLEKYPDVEQRIRELYDQKQKAQNTVKMLKRAIQLITQAKENLANRYLSKVEDTFNDYMQVWMDDDAIRGSLDIDFNIEIEKDDKKNPAEGYSTGTCDLIDFCMRLALVDTLFEQEQPFLILDDPFVNLDEEHLNKALELLNVMAADKQMIYFVCHPIRAVEANVDAALREKFVKLAEDNRKTIEERKSVRTEQKKIARKSPKEMYRMVSAAAAAPFRPAKPDYTITNNIFSMDLVLDGQGMPRDNSYELFFIDAVGHVLNDRQLVEVKDGKLSNERVLFCLITRDDSGDQYELMIRESGQDDYEVVARIPFKAKLAFAGTFRFNF